MPFKNTEEKLAYGRAYYYANAAIFKSRAKAHTNRVRAEVKIAVVDYLQTHPCIDCGESDPVVLEFDHRNGSNKLFAIGAVLNKGFAIKTIMNEIEKCDVRCANCHRRRTAQSLGWYRTLKLI